MEFLPVYVGGLIIVILGIIDDIIELAPRYKLLGQIAAALCVTVWGHISIGFINIPFYGQLEFGVFGIPISILWIVAIINALNLIDGLDGLAGGVSFIALMTIAGMAILLKDTFVAPIAFVLAAAVLGFLIFNFPPASIFMGDTGAQFLGYMIAVLSLMGFKNVTFISLLVPIIILGVPLSDTFFCDYPKMESKSSDFHGRQIASASSTDGVRLYTASNGAADLCDGIAVFNDWLRILVFDYLGRGYFVDLIAYKCRGDRGIYWFGWGKLSADTAVVAEDPS